MSQVRLSVRWGKALLASLLSAAVPLLLSLPAGALTPAGAKLSTTAQVQYHDGMTRTSTSKLVVVTVGAKSGAAVTLPVAAATVSGTQAFPCILTNTGNSVADIRMAVTMTANTDAWIVRDAHGDGVWRGDDEPEIRSVPGVAPGASVPCFLVVQPRTSAREGAVGGVTVFAASTAVADYQSFARFTPTFAAPGLRPAFAFEAPEPITSSPIVRNGMAFVGTQSGVLYAVSVAGDTAGKVVWRFPATGSLGAPIRGRVAPDGDTYYVAADNGMLYKLDAKGQPLWKTVVSTHPGPMVAMPILHESGVTLACGDGRVRRIDGKTGEVLSVSYPVGDNGLGTPSMPSRDELWVGGSDGNLYNMKADQAFTILAAHPISDGPVSTTPFVDSRTSLVVAVSSEGNVYAMRLRTSEMVWGPVSLGSPVKGSPFVNTDSGTIYVTTADGALHALRITDGIEVEGYPVRLSQADGPASSPVVVPLGSRATIFVGGTAGRFYAVNANTPARMVWFDAGDRAARFSATPALSGPSMDDLVVATAGRSLYGFLVREVVSNL